MEEHQPNQNKLTWKSWLLKILLYAVVGFLCAFLYHQLKK